MSTQYYLPLVIEEEPDVVREEEELHLLDGTMILGREQKKILMKNPYFEALFLRWSNGQMEYQVDLTINTIRFLLGEINQLELLVQASQQAIDSARGELDMVGAVLQPIDIESPEYPLTLYPLLQPYQIRRNHALPLIPTKKTLEIYRLMVVWGIRPQVSDLAGLINHADFPAYLRFFWENDPVQFIGTQFSERMIAQIIRFPEAFTSPLTSYLPTLRKNLESYFPYYSRELISFYAQILGISLSDVIDNVLNTRPDHDLLKKIIQIDKTKLYRCLQFSLRENSYRRSPIDLLNQCKGLTSCPLTEEQIISLRGQDQIYAWLEEQAYPDLPMAVYQIRLNQSMTSAQFPKAREIITRFPTYPFQITFVVASFCNNGEMIKFILEHSHLKVIFPSDAYRTLTSAPYLNFLLRVDPCPNFGICQVNFNQTGRDILLKHQVYKFAHHAFVGNLETARLMFQAAITSGVVPHVEYLNYFIKQKAYDLLPSCEAIYKQSSNRFPYLTEVLQTAPSATVTLFLQWEATFH